MESTYGKVGKWLAGVALAELSLLGTLLLANKLLKPGVARSAQQSPLLTPLDHFHERKRDLTNLRTRVSKAKAKIALAATPDERAEAEWRHDRLKTELKQLEQEVDHLRTQQNLAA